MDRQTSRVYRNEHSYCGPISMLRRLQCGDLLVAFREARRRERPTHADPTTRSSLIRSTDGGSSWHSLVTPDPAGGNGVTLAVLSDSTLLLTNFRWIFAPAGRDQHLRSMGGYRTVDALGLAAACEGIYVTRSREAGYTWECPRRLQTPGLDFATTAGRVVEMSDGSSLLMPVNGPEATYVYASRDRGESWGILSTVARAAGPRGLQEMRILNTGDDELLAVMRTPEGSFVSSISRDCGRSWGATAQTPMWCGGSSPADLLLLSDGRVLCTYGHRRPPFGVRACVSSDRGVSWNIEREIVLRDDGPDRDVGYPSSEELADGTILTVYYWHDEDGVRYLAATRWAAPPA